MNKLKNRLHSIVWLSLIFFSYLASILKMLKETNPGIRIVRVKKTSVKEGKPNGFYPCFIVVEKACHRLVWGPLLIPSFSLFLTRA